MVTNSSRLLKKQGKVLLDFGSGTVRVYADGVLIKSCRSSFSLPTINNSEEFHLVERGTVVDFEAGKKFLNNLFKDLIEAKKIWPRFDGFYLLPSDASQVDQIIVKKILNALDNGTWRLVKKKTVARSKAGCVIDIGFDLTEVILGINVGRKTAKTLKIGSRAFTSVIREVIRDKYQLDISWQVADKIKRELVGASYLLSAEKNTQKITVRGKDIYSFVPKTLPVNASDLKDPLLKVALDFFEELKLYFSVVSTDLLMNSLEEGVELWGEGSRLAGLEDFFSQKLQTNVKVAAAHYEV